MKKTTLSVLFIALIYIAMAQAPQSFSYQAVARDAGGQLLASSSISVRVSILDSAVGGFVVYRESHSVNTNQFGLFTIAIGAGTNVTGTLNSIPWVTGNKWVMIEVDTAGGTNFAFVGEFQLLSVPYAIYATSAEHTDTASFASNAFHADSATNSGHAVYADTALYAVNASHADSATNSAHAVRADSALYAPGTGISFFASSDTNTIIVPDSNVLIPFQTINFNDGNAYDNVANAFTAPSAGLYHFDLGLNFTSTTGGSQVYINLTVNNFQSFSPTAQVTLDNINSLLPCNISTNLKLNQGDVVTVIAFNYGSGTNLVNIGGGNYFSGYKVW